MAGEHSRAKDQWKDSLNEHGNVGGPGISFQQPRARSPAVTARLYRDLRRPSSSSPSPSRERPLPQRSPQHSTRGRRAPLHSGVSRDNDLYRPGSRTYGDTARDPPPDRENIRERGPSPRRPSPDSYIPASRRRGGFRLPRGSSTYRPGEDNARPRSRSPPRHPKNRRAPFSKPRRRSPSPLRPRRSPPRRPRREPDLYVPARRPRSPSPANRRATRPRSRPRSPGIHRDTRGRPDNALDGRDELLGPLPHAKQEMRPSYPPYGAGGRGGPRHLHDPYAYSGAAQYPPPPPPHHHQSPYGAGRGWPAHSPYPSSHHGSPYQQHPHRQSSYPPPTPGYYPPPPPQFYGGSPPYPPQAYSHLHQDHRSSGGHTSPASRGGPSGRRGHYSNLSWTPASGSRGGTHQVSSKDKKEPDSARSEVADNDDDDDDPFRPSKDLRAEDERRDDRSHNQTQSRAETDADQRFRIAPKGPALSSTLGLPATALEVPPKKELRLVKRIKPRPTLPPDFAASESVYYRKPGNESVVGSGTYGKVFRAIHVYTGEKVALKKIRMEGERDGFPVTAIREVKLLQSLNHDNVVKLQEVMVEKNDCYMVFEYLSHDLTGLLNHPFFKLQDAHKKHLARQLFEGLDHLHRRGVLHRDIKAANILISNTGQLKIADFGLARFFAKRRQLDYTNRVITIWYRSPELLLGETQYGPAVDIWSAACVLVEIFTKHAIFPGDGGEINQLDKIYNVLGTPTRSDWPNIVEMAWFELLRPTERRPSTFAEKYKERVTPAAFDLLTSMFAFDPKKRPSAEEVLKHTYFQEEDPSPKRALELQELEGDWHEFESKALRKEKERRDREERKAKEREEHEAHKRKKTNDTEAAVSGSSEGRDVKRQKLETSERGESSVGSGPVSALNGTQT